MVLSRNRALLNEEFIAALLRHFRREGERAITRMANAAGRVLQTARPPSSEGAQD